MVKKIAKYSKFVLCIALILSLVAPSYAALSASDGSAFVTKAEFDSALADFNARLTTFEAGINSKIDSQVTSYLDRNGIWNGKVQPISFTDWRDTSEVEWQPYTGVGSALKFEATATTTSAVAYYGLLASYNWKYQGNMNGYKLINGENMLNFQPFVSTISKSGLVWVSGEMKKFHKNDSTNYKWVAGTTSVYTFSPILNVVHEMFLAEKDTGTGAVKRLNVFPIYWDQTINGFSPFPNEPQMTKYRVSVSGFVSSGNSLGVVCDNLVTHTDIYSQWGKDSSRLFGLTFVPDSAMVY